MERPPTTTTMKTRHPNPTQQLPGPVMGSHTITTNNNPAERAPAAVRLSPGRSFLAKSKPSSPNLYQRPLCICTFRDEQDSILPSGVFVWLGGWRGKVWTGRPAHRGTQVYRYTGMPVCRYRQRALLKLSDAASDFIPPDKLGAGPWAHRTKSDSVQP